MTYLGMAIIKAQLQDTIMDVLLANDHLQGLSAARIQPTVYEARRIVVKTERKRSGLVDSLIFPILAIFY